ncbi:MAG: response regulator transcription factor [Steroidobacteraceae bacterium]
MNSATRSVFVVDDDWQVRAAITRILTASGFEVRTFESSERFLQEHDADAPGCLLLELCLPGSNGIELQRELNGLPTTRPIVFMSGKADVQTSVKAMKAGAVDFLTKPIDSDKLITAIKQALKRDAEQRLKRATRNAVEIRLMTLTRREREVMGQLIRGRINKQIAAMLGAGEKTIKVHRARVMSKMGADSVAELVQLCAHGGVAMEFELDPTRARRGDDQAGELFAAVAACRIGGPA